MGVIDDPDPNSGHEENSSSSEAHKYRQKKNAVKMEEYLSRNAYRWPTEYALQWLKKYCADLYQLYGEIFREQDINGQVLLGLNDRKLLLMGIEDSNHRDELLQQILGLKLKMDLYELQKLNRIH